MGAYQLESLRQAERDIEGSYGFWGTGGLLDGIDKALAAPQLSELYGLASTTASRIKDQAVALDTAAVKVAQLALRQLPAAIEAAQTRVAAEDAMSILGGLLSDAAARLQKAAYELDMLGQQMEDISAGDKSGVKQLDEARARLVKIDGFFEYDSSEMDWVHRAACNGVSSRLDAHENARRLAEAMTDLLNGLPDRPVLDPL